MRTKRLSFRQHQEHLRKQDLARCLKDPSIPAQVKAAAQRIAQVESEIALRDAMSRPE